MPFDEITELPEAVRKVLTEDAQKVFLAAFNDALKESNADMPNPEIWAARAAWRAVGQQYQMGDDGRYVAVVESAMFTDSSPLTMVEHDSILQTLDRESKGYYLGKEHFEPTVKEWDTVPLIFAQQHPDPDAWDKDSKAELERIKGKVIKGHATGTYIETTGHPRLMTTFSIEDKAINDGIAKGEISTSNGFRVKHKDGKLTDTVRPHHILFFHEKAGGPVPGDKGAFILNTDNPKEEGLRLIDRMKALFLGGAGGSTEEDGKDMTDNKELEGKLAIAQKEAEDARKASLQFQTDMAKREEELKAVKADLEKQKNDNLAFIQKEKDAKWGAFKAKHIPPGMVAKPEDEKALREKFDLDPMTFTEDLLNAKAKGRKEGAEEGLEFTDSGEAKAERVGRYDSDTGKWK